MYLRQLTTTTSTSVSSSVSVKNSEPSQTKAFIASAPPFDIYSLVSAPPKTTGWPESVASVVTPSQSASAGYAPKATKAPEALGIAGLQLASPAGLGDQFKSGISTGVRVAAFALGGSAGGCAAIAGAIYLVRLAAKKRAKIASDGSIS